MLGNHFSIVQEKFSILFHKFKNRSYSYNVIEWQEVPIIQFHNMEKMLVIQFHSMKKKARHTVS